MLEHVHIIVVPSKDDDRIGPVLKSIKQSVARRAVHWVQVNKPALMGQLEDVAPSGEVTHRFWQRGAGHDRNLYSPNATWNIIEYIHLNPVRRGLVKRAEDWEWSSSRNYMKLREGPLDIDFDSLPRLPTKTY